MKRYEQLLAISRYEQLIAISAIIILVAGFVTLTIIAISDSPKRENVDSEIINISYVKDTRTDLCYAVTYNQVYETDLPTSSRVVSGLSNVPCSEKVEGQVKTYLFSLGGK